MILVSETMVRRIEPYPHCASTRGLNKAYGEGCGTVKLKGCFNTHSPTYLMVQQVWRRPLTSTPLDVPPTRNVQRW